MTRVIEITELSLLQDMIHEQAYTIVDFAAESWCVPCQRFKPHFDAVSNKFEGVAFVHVDIDKADSDLVNHFGVQSVPTVMFFNGYIGDRNYIEARTGPVLMREIYALTTAL